MATLIRKYAEDGPEEIAIVDDLRSRSWAEMLVVDLAVYCRNRPAGFKVPRSFDFEPSLPRHSSGKLYKRLLRDRYWRDLDRHI